MRRRRGFSHSRGRRSSRKTRWTGATWALALTLETDPTVGREWASFWIKFPASMSRKTAPPATEDEVVSNEPVDETLIRTIDRTNGLVLNAGTGGHATNPANFMFGIIPFDGGEYPDFYDFAVFSEATSLVAPPNPILQNDDPWILRHGALADSEVQEYSNNEGPDLFCHSRSKRKLPAGMGLLFVVAVTNFFSNASSPLVFNVGGDVRIAVRSGFSV